MKYLEVKDLKEGMLVDFEYVGKEHKGWVVSFSVEDIYIVERCFDERGERESCLLKNCSNMTRSKVFHPVEGDVLVDEEGDKRFVLGVSGEIVHMSCIANHSVLSFPATKEVLTAGGYKIKDIETEEIKEVSMDEVAEKFGVDVKGIRIKKEDV